MKKVILLLICIMCFSFSLGCNQKKDGVKKIKLAHNFSVSHPFHSLLKSFASDVYKKSNAKIKIDIFPNSVLGPDRTVMEQLQGGVVEMMKIGSSTLEPFDPMFSVFALPYLFKNEAQFHKVFQGSLIEHMNKRMKKRNHFVILTYFPTGVRCFYTKKTPILHPSDLKGLKIRVMNSKTSIEMIKLLGGMATPMPYGEIYTALQQGVIDGAENNPVALTISKQGEVAKAYSFDEHVIMPDFLLINIDTWLALTPKEQKILKKASDDACIRYTKIWEKEITKAIKQAKEKMGVKFYYPKKKPFQKMVMPLHAEFKKDPMKAKIIDYITNTK